MIDERRMMRKTEIVKWKGREYVILYTTNKIICYDSRGKALWSYVESASPAQPGN